MEEVTRRMRFLPLAEPRAKDVARLPPTIHDKRFEWKIADRSFVCDSCNKLYDNRNRGQYMTKCSLPVSEREAAWRSGSWDARWYCVRCIQISYDITYEAALERLGFSQRIEKKNERSANSCTRCSVVQLC